MDIRGYIYGLVDIFPSPLKTPARWVADRAFSVWDDVSNVFRVVVPKWANLYGSVIHFTEKTVIALAAAANVARWLVLVKIPQLVENLRVAVVTWTSELINDVRQFAQGLVTAVAQWVAARVAEIVAFLTSLRDWILARLAEIWAPLRIVIDRVAMLLFDPEAFAAWVIGALWGAFWRFAWAHLDVIVEAAWARRGIVVTAALNRAETILEKVL